MRKHTLRRPLIAAVTVALALAVGGCAGLGGGGTPGDDGTAMPTDATAGPATGSPTGSVTDPPASSPAYSPTAPASPAPTETRRTVVVIPAITMQSPTIVDAGGYVEGVIEVGGTCKYTITQGTTVVSGQAPANPDASTTWCDNVDLTLANAADPWTLELRYESPKSVGTGRVTSDGKIS